MHTHPVPTDLPFISQPHLLSLALLQSLVVCMHMCVPVHAHTTCAHRPAIFSIPAHLPDNLGVVRPLYPTGAGKMKFSVAVSPIGFPHLFQKKPQVHQKENN